MPFIYLVNTNELFLGGRGEGGSHNACRPLKAEQALLSLLNLFSCWQRWANWKIQKIWNFSSMVQDNWCESFTCLSKTSLLFNSPLMSTFVHPVSTCSLPKDPDHLSVPHWSDRKRTREIVHSVSLFLLNQSRLFRLVKLCVMSPFIVNEPIRDLLVPRVID